MVGSLAAWDNFIPGPLAMAVSPNQERHEGKMYLFRRRFYDANFGDEHIAQLWQEIPI